MTEVCGRLVHLETPCLDANARPYFKDVLDHVRRVEAMVNSLRDVLTSVFEVSNLLEQQRQGAITRQLAAWAAILAVPTAIAGIYGMNFENMPELKTQYGYFGAFRKSLLIMQTAAGSARLTDRSGIRVHLAKPSRRTSPL